MTNFLLEICCNNQEVERVEEEEEEEFFESLDRILSSSSSSCSSDNDEVGPAVKPSSGGQIPADGIFPMPNLSSYDVWIAEPASVNERRQRFLRQLGLSSDKSLSRVNSGLGSPPRLCREVENASARRAASCDQIVAERSENAGGGSPVAIARSSSDGATTSTAEFALDSLHCFPPHSDLNSIQQEDSSPLVYTNQYHALSSLPKNGSGSRSSPAPPSKPPSGKFSPRSSERIKSSDHLNWNPSFVDDSENVNDPRICTIKNLDNGDEFVVNEFGEDGMWNKLREIGTGRQLTREEFEMCVVGHSPIVQELMRRQGVEESGLTMDDEVRMSGRNGIGPKSKKKGGGWLKSLRNVASSVTGHHRERRSSDERDTSSEKGGRRSSSATDDSQDVLFHAPERTKVRHYGKSSKELTALYMSQEIQAHNGSIWSIKFSLDGRYLASAGEDRVIHIWQVTESDRKGDLLFEKLEEGNSNHFLAVKGSPELILVSSNGDSHLEQKKRGKISYSRKSMNLDHVVVPESVFALSEKPVCSFRGHLADVLDLSWSKSEHLLSSSMDKTVRLWHMSSRSCLKMFSHSDYVTCIQFNPVDDRYFISGSLDAKVRIWSIPDRQVVDWNDLHEMVTAACYTPDGKGALVGSHKGSCHLYNTSDNKLHQKSQISLQNKKKKAHVKKITGFQFTPGSSSEVLVTSADSRIRVLDGVDLVHKFKGFRNTSSQISAVTNGNYVVCASEDSQVYVWRYDSDSRPTRGKGVNITRSYEYFHCQDVSVAIPWPGFRCCQEISSRGEPNLSGISEANPVDPADSNGHGVPQSAYDSVSSPMHFHAIPNSNGSYFSDRVSVTWPEEKLLLSTTTATITATDKRIPPSNGSFGSGRSAWGMVIVTAGLGGEIRAFQNFGLPIRI